MKNNLFPALFAAITAEETKRLNDSIEELNKVETTAKILDVWYYKQLLTAGAKRKIWEPADLKAYLIKRMQKFHFAKLDKQLKHLENISEAGELVEITIQVEWKNNRTWGANPRAEIDVKSKKEYSHYDRFLSASIGGCGYDKESTAVAQALNQSPELLKALYLLKEKNPTAVNRDFFGYGSGYGILPMFEGGVGVSCYPDIFKKLGFNWKQTGNGKMFNCYLISKIA